jgi:hypothetical protein
MAEELRTSEVDIDVLAAICSPIVEARTEAILELPEALSREEIRAIKFQIYDMTSSINSKQYARDAVFHIGTTALYKRLDVVTASSSSSELIRDKSVMGVVGYFMIRNAIRGVHRDIVDDLLTPPDKQQ